MKTNKSLFKIASLILMLILLFIGGVKAQTNTAPVTIPTPPEFLSFDFLTNLPTATNFQAAKFGASAGVVLGSGQAESALKLDLYEKTNWMFSAEIQNSPSTTIVDNFSLLAGYREAWANAEIYFQGGARMTWANDVTPKRSFQGIAAVGASWLPMTGGKFMLGTELRLLTAETGSVFNQRPSGEVLVFTKLLF